MQLIGTVLGTMGSKMESEMADAVEAIVESSATRRKEGRMSYPPIVDHG